MLVLILNQYFLNLYFNIGALMLILITDLLIAQAVIPNALLVKHLAQIVYYAEVLIEIQIYLHARNFNLNILI